MWFLVLLLAAFTAGCASDEIEPPISAKAITSYSFGGFAGSINETAKTISVTLPYGTVVTNLIATFTTTGQGVPILGGVDQLTGTTPNNFTTPKSYIVTAADGTTATYTVTVTVAGTAGPAGAAPVLGLAGTYGIIASDAMTSSSALSHIYGDVALTDPASTSAQVTGAGFMDAGALPGLTSSGVTNSDGTNPGVITTTDNGTPANIATLPQLQADLEAAYNDNKLGSLTRVAPGAVPTPTGNGGTFTPGAVDLSGLVLRPGIYAVGTATDTYTIAAAGAPLVLDAQGNVDAVFVFQADTMTTPASAGSVLLQNGTQAKNVYWVLTNNATIGTNTFFQGTIVAGRTITVNAGASVQGRMLAGGDVAAPAGTGNITVSGVISVP